MTEVIILEIEGKTFSILHRRKNYKKILSIELDEKQLKELEEIEGKYVKRVNREHRCSKCGKQIPISIIPYQRLGQLEDICLCNEEDPYVKYLIKKGIVENGKIVLKTS